MNRRNGKMEHIMAAAIAAGTVLSTLTAFAETYAKLENGTFAFYADAECTEPNTSQTNLNANTTLYFASAGDFDALKSYKEEIVSSGAKVTMLNNITLTYDADWRDFDFYLNGKTVTLKGWDLIVGKPQGEGRITSGNLINSTGFTTTDYSYKDGSWYVFKGKESDGRYPGTKRLYQSFTLPKARSVYLQFRTKSWNKSGYKQYVGAGIDANTNIVDKFQSGTQTTTSSHILTAGPYTVENLAVGSTHELRFTNFQGWTYAGNICLCPTSQLTFDIPEGEEFENTGITLGGSSDTDFTGIGLKVYKKGGGKIVFSKSNASWRYDGHTSLVVDEGYAKQTAKNACGAQYSKIAVHDGGQFDINGFTYWDYHYAISGTGPADDGALTSSAAIGEADARKTEKKGFLYDVTLDADATVCASEGANFGMWVFYPEGGSSYNNSTMTMNGHTVTYDCLTPGGAIIYLGGMSYSGKGKIVVAANARVQPHNKNLEAKGCDVEVYGDWKQNNYVLSPVKSLVFKEGSKFGEWNNSPAKTTVVLERYAPNQGVEDGDPPGKHPRVQLGSADSPKELNAGLERPVVTLDLTEFNGVFDDSEKGLLTFYNTGNEDAPTKVYVEVNEKRCLRGHILYKWKTKPENVEFVRGKAMEDAQMQLQVNDDGLYAGPGSTIILR